MTCPLGRRGPEAWEAIGHGAAKEKGGGFRKSLSGGAAGLEGGSSPLRPAGLADPLSLAVEPAFTEGALPPLQSLSVSSELRRLLLRGDSTRRRSERRRHIADYPAKRRGSWTGHVRGPI